MRKNKIGILFSIWIFFTIIATGIYIMRKNKGTDTERSQVFFQKKSTRKEVTAGTEKYRGFLLNNVLHSRNLGDIHYNVYIPNHYNQSEPYALYVTVPGYQGLYFQGIGKNIETEEFGFVAQKYNEKMIVVAPQLEDWQEKSANQIIELIEYFLKHYSIDSSKVYANGYSGGGETMSIVMGKRPDLFAAYLHCASKWDGNYEILIRSETPVYIVIGENDEYYGSQSSKQTYQDLYERYKNKGLSDKQINTLLILDLKATSYFERRGVTHQHESGSQLFAQDKKVMSWLFSQRK